MLCIHETDVVQSYKRQNRTCIMVNQFCGPISAEPCPQKLADVIDHVPFPFHHASAELKAGARLYGIEQFLTQGCLVVELWQLE